MPKKKDLHFIVLTDQQSVPYLAKIFQKFIHRDLKTKTNKINVTYDFIDTEVIVRAYMNSIREMRPFFTSNSIQARKYRDDLFLIGPYYHRIFPYDKLIMLDADLKFRIDIAELFDHFDHFSSDQVMGVGIDLAPHYRIAFGNYRRNNPGTKVGEPGRFQV